MTIPNKSASSVSVCFSWPLNELRWKKCLFLLHVWSNPTKGANYRSTTKDIITRYTHTHKHKNLVNRSTFLVATDRQSYLYIGTSTDLLLYDDQLRVKFCSTNDRCLHFQHCRSDNFFALLASRFFFSVSMSTFSVPRHLVFLTLLDATGGPIKVRGKNIPKIIIVPSSWWDVFPVKGTESRASLRVLVDWG